ncbi:NERD domain-containing protein [Defluviitalea phaphyphila]|uniref:NERD domain-containing protein n=1 Tax=Defluviitalea phaphyphila TaxID=1473580 RepID=UPI00073016A1|nr:NERD domain-containing protein [Defluviitalea phaphyphila]
MAKVIQKADYIKKRKKKYFIYTVISFTLMIIIFLLGIIINNSKYNLFTLFAILFTLPVAQYAVQFISILKYRDGDIKVAKELEKLPDSYIIWNSALFADNIGMAFFDHIVFTDKKIFFILDKPSKTYKENLKTMKRIIENKGLKNNVVFIEKYKQDLTKLIDIWNKEKIKSKDRQEEFVKLLQSSAIM